MTYKNKRGASRTGKAGRKIPRNDLQHERDEKKERGGKKKKMLSSRGETLNERRYERGRGYGFG